MLGRRLVSFGKPTQTMGGMDGHNDEFRGTAEAKLFSETVSDAGSFFFLYSRGYFRTNGAGTLPSVLLNFISLFSVSEYSRDKMCKSHYNRITFVMIT